MDADALATWVSQRFLFLQVQANIFSTLASATIFENIDLEKA
jgi:hypothetical protein